ncbi:MAG: CBS domain-containing protein [Rhodospirillaceae bacterium]
MPNRRIQEVLRNQRLLHLAPDVSVREAARQMSARRVAAVLVTEGAGEDKLDGIFTERDLLERVVVPGLDPDTTTLAKVMTSAPATVSPGSTVGEALAIMDAKGVRHLPVTVEGRALGVISMRDFVADEVAVLDWQHEMERQYAENMR